MISAFSVSVSGSRSTCLMHVSCFFTAMMTPLPGFALGLSLLWLLYSLANLPGSPISPSALTGFSHVSVITTMSGSVLSTEFWKHTFLSDIDCAFTFRIFRFCGAILFLLDLNFFDVLKISVSAGAMEVASSLRTLAWSMSGTHALLGSSLSRSFLTPGSVKWISSISGCRSGVLWRSVSGVSSVTSDWSELWVQYLCLANSIVYQVTGRRCSLYHVTARWLRSILPPRTPHNITHWQVVPPARPPSRPPSRWISGEPLIWFQQEHVVLSQIFWIWNGTIKPYFNMTYTIPLYMHRSQFWVR